MNASRQSCRSLRGFAVIDMVLRLLSLGRTVILFLLLSMVGILHARDEGGASRADEVLLVINEESAVSKDIAQDYARARHVTHRLGIHCADSAASTENETISYSDYMQAIEKPIVSYLARHRSVTFIVLTKGIPIRIVGADTGERPDHSSVDTPLRSSVDSRLAALGYSAAAGDVKMQITGSGATGVGWANRYWNSHEPFNHAKFGGYLVTRLDGYTKADAEGLVRRAIVADKKPPAGKVLFDVQPILGLGAGKRVPFPLSGTVIAQESSWDEFNADMVQAAELLKRRGIPYELDVSPIFVGRRSDLAGYFSWGSNDPKFDSKAYEALNFSAGSIGDTAVSTSGRTFLPTEGGQSLVADLIAHGLTCVKGYTDEPLLQAIASPTIVMDRYTSGHCMAESFYAASHFVGWQDVVIGDPLCCPYRTRNGNR